LINIPSLYIAGFPKTGTTSIATMLSASGFFSTPLRKEPHYFSPEFPHLRGLATLNDYQNNYSSSVAGMMDYDASTWYLYSDSAIEKIVRENPDAKFIIGLRDPFQFLLSYADHLERKEYASNAMQSFIAGHPRSESLNCDIEDDVGYLFDWKERLSFDVHLKRMYGHVDPKNIYMYYLEDYIENPQEVINRISELTSIPTLKNMSSIHANKGGRVRKNLISQGVMSLRKELGKSPVLEKMVRGYRIGLGGKVYRSLTRTDKKASRSSEELCELRQLTRSFCIDQIDSVYGISVQYMQPAVSRRCKLLLKSHAR